MNDKVIKIAAVVLVLTLAVSIITSSIISITGISLIAKSASGPAYVAANAAPGGSSGGAQQGNNGGSSGQSGTVTPTSPNVVVTGSAGSNSTTAPSGGSNAPTQPSGSGETQAQAPQGMSKKEVFDIYKAAVDKVKNSGAASYNKKEWQELPVLTIGNNATVNNFVQEKAAGYMTTPDEAEVQVTEKGEKSMDRFPPCTLTDMDKIASATAVDKGDYYEVTIVMQDEDTPLYQKSFLAEITNSLLYWDKDIQPELENIGGISVDSISILYNDYTITAQITKDGQFKQLQHLATVDITVSAKVLKILPLNGTGTLINTAQYTDFAY